MAKQQGTILSLLAWITGVVVSLVVGNAMIDGVLTLPAWIGGGAAPWIATAIGWIVVITTLVSAVLALLKK